MLIPERTMHGLQFEIVLKVMLRETTQKIYITTIIFNGRASTSEEGNRNLNIRLKLKRVNDKCCLKDKQMTLTLFKCI